MTSVVKHEKLSNYDGQFYWQLKYSFFCYHMRFLRDSFYSSKSRFGIWLNFVRSLILNCCKLFSALLPFKSSVIADSFLAHLSISVFGILDASTIFFRWMFVRAATPFNEQLSFGFVQFFSLLSLNLNEIWSRLSSPEKEQTEPNHGVFSISRSFFP